MIQNTELLDKIHKKVFFLSERIKSGTLQDTDWNTTLICIAKEALGGIVSCVQEKKIPFPFQPTDKIYIMDLAEKERTGIYEIQSIENNEVKVFGTDVSGYKIRSCYSLSNLGNRWEYRKVPKKMEVVSWEDLHEMTGKNVYVSPKGVEHYVPITITGFGYVNDEEKMFATRDGHSDKKSFGFLSKGKCWDAYVETVMPVDANSSREECESDLCERSE